MVNLTKITEFDWDKGNRRKNEIKHGVLDGEIEEVFFKKPNLVLPDIKHSRSEERHYILGRSNKGRYIFVSFTVRGNKFRVISARDQNKRERQIYEKIT
jgi:hypothetical protein